MLGAGAEGKESHRPNLCHDEGLGAASETDRMKKRAPSGGEKEEAETGGRGVEVREDTLFLE